MIKYADLPDRYSGYGSSAIAVLPVAFDKTSTWIKGADRGPVALLQASANLELYDIETGSEVYKRGIYTSPGISAPELSDVESMLAAVEREISAFVRDGKLPVTIGGEHSISLAPVRALKRVYPGLSVLQFDAHSDMRDEYRGSKYNHACVMARISEICPAVQTGIRSMDSSELPGIVPERLFYAWDMLRDDLWIDRAEGCLSGEVYVTIDLDGLDPGIMPSTGTPEPGGVDWYTLLRFLKRIASKKRIVGFDIVELCPGKRPAAPEFLAAKLLYTLLSYIFEH